MVFFIRDLPCHCSTATSVNKEWIWCTACDRFSNVKHVFCLLAADTHMYCSDGASASFCV